MTNTLRHVTAEVAKDHMLSVVYGSDFLTTTTNGWYADPVVTPKIETFRDMVSVGQLYSKLWLLQQLLKVVEPANIGSIAVAGSWLGSLVWGLHQCFRSAIVTGVDIDPNCTRYCEVVYNTPRFEFVTDDMYNHNWRANDYQIVVNTSCEHISDLEGWLRLLPPRTIVVLQSNNYTSCVDHIACSSSLDEFIARTGLSEVILADELEFPMYTRYMVIGRVGERS